MSPIECQGFLAELFKPVLNLSRMPAGTPRVVMVLVFIGVLLYFPREQAGDNARSILTGAERPVKRDDSFDAFHLPHTGDAEIRELCAGVPVPTRSPGIRKKR